MGRKSNRKSKAAPGTRIEVVSGRTNFNYAANSNNVIPLTPASFARCLVMADVFQFYRFRKCRVMVIPADNSVVVAYAPGAAFDTPPTTFAGLIELPIAKYHGAAKFSETIMEIPYNELIRDSQLPWFKTIAGTPAVQFETQGNIYVSTGAGATGGIVVIEWTCEFQSWNLAAQSPMVKSGIPSAPKVLKPNDVSDSGSSDCIVVGGQTYRKSIA